MGQGTRGFSLRHELHAVSKIKFVYLYCLLILLFYVPPAKAQDSPGRYELGGNLTVLKTDVGANFGPGLEGDFNFGRHFALDAALNWMPANTPGHVTQGLFGVKVGTRTQRFGFFGKVRPGFVTRGDALVQETIDLNGSLLTTPQSTPRFARLTERAIDFGGVFEYYPSKHWALRYDMGDTVIFEQAFRLVLVNPPPGFIAPPGFPNQTRNRFQFSTGLHYRF